MKRLLALLCSLALVFCLIPSTAFASGGNGNIDGGGGGMGQGTSSNFWNPGNDGVRITVVDAASGAAVSSPLDFSNRTQKSSILHFGKVNKLQYLSGTGLSLQSGVAYSCIKPAQSMPTIVSSKGQSNIDAIKRYFCSEYACMMVAQAAGVDYERMIAGEYKLLIEPIAYFTHNGQYYCIVPTASGKSMKSGYGVKQDVTATLSTDAPTSHITHPQTAFSVFPEFQYETYLRLLQRVSSGRSAKFTFQPNEFSTYSREVHFTEDEEPQQSATITVLASPEQARIITEMENDGVAHVALISRNNDQLAEELLAEQDKTLQEIYFPETLVEENAESQDGGETAEGAADSESTGESGTENTEGGVETTPADSIPEDGESKPLVN